MERHALRDDQFARIEYLLPGRPGTVGRNSDLGNRLFVDAVIWKFRVGTPWRDLPERFGGWCNTHKRFSRWAVSGVRMPRGAEASAHETSPRSGDRLRRTAIARVIASRRRFQAKRRDHPAAIRPE